MNALHMTHERRIGRALTLAASVGLALTLGSARRAEAVACSTSICTSTGTNTCSVANTTLDSGCPGGGGPCVLDWGSSMDVTVSGTLNADLEVFSGRTIDVPSCFIGGKSDWGVYQKPGDLEAMQTKACTRMLAVHLVEGAGHWVQQEQPEKVSALLLEFLRQRA